MKNELAIIKKSEVLIPEIVGPWEYDESVKKFRNLFKAVRENGEEALGEFKRAYDELIADSNKKKGRRWPDKTFGGYCGDIEISHTTANKWLKEFFGIRRVCNKLQAPSPPGLDPILLEGDILDRIHDIPDNSIDLLITDPPYGITDEAWDQFDDYLSFLRRVMQAIVPKLKAKHSGFIFADARMMYPVREVLANYFDIKNTLIWIRKNMAMGRVIKDRFISSYEPIFYFGARDLNLPEEWGGERFDSFEFAVPQTNFNDTKVHPTQKPIELFRRLITVGSFDGDIILDCFAGSGTTGVITKELGRTCYLVEKDQNYINVIKQRVGISNE
ncbi:MAG: site-specific DNA-methyltransferase [bacterium]